MSKKAMKKIGLTGVMGAGKSTVIKILEELHIPILDCDAINADLLRKGNAGYRKLKSTFGDCILDENDTISKQKMSFYIFSDKALKTKAEQILHPLIKAEIKRMIEQYQEAPYVVVEVPLLFEVQWESFFDEVWVVASDEALLLKRLMKYRQVSEKEAKRRLAHQLPQEIKIKKADVVLYNNDDKESLRKQICDILNRKL